MARVGMDAEAVKVFKKGRVRPVKKRTGGSEKPAKAQKGRKPRQDSFDPKNVSGGVLKGIMRETIADVYAEMWPSMQVRNSEGGVHAEIEEEAYILMLTMICGTEKFKPRQTLKIRETSSPDLKFCSEHKE